MSVRKLKLGEYGRELLFNAGTDISGADEYKIEFTKPDGSTLEVVAALGVGDITVPDKSGTDVTFISNEYATYTIAAGVIDQVGRWTYRLLAPSVTISVPGECGSLEVED